MQKWNMNCARMIGLSHVKNNLPCQDNAMVNFANGVNVIALSDGCGSSRISEIGSETVVDFICEFFTGHFDEIYSQNEFSIKKLLTNGLMERYNLSLQKFKDQVDSYIQSPFGKSAYDDLKSYQIAQNLDEESLKELYFRMIFDATVLFVSVKEDKFIIGHCGDGFIIGIDNKKLTILSQEPKAGPSNETTYPSSILALVKAYKDESNWDAFRIKKGESANFSGFALMSDGAEKSLIRKYNNVSSPVLNNDSILFEIVANENEEDAKSFLTEILDKEYRQIIDSNGEEIEITDDDVSVAVMVKPDYVIDGIETSISQKSEKKTPNEKSQIEVRPKNDIKKESVVSEEQKKVVANLLGKETSEFDEEKFKWLICMMNLYLEFKNSKDESFSSEDLQKYLSQKTGKIIDDDDLKQISRYLDKCNIIKFEASVHGN